MVACPSTTPGTTSGTASVYRAFNGIVYDVLLMSVSDSPLAGSLPKLTGNSLAMAG
jgi:hypothetical protein